MGEDAISLRAATRAERDALEALQRRSSMHQPMYREQLEASGCDRASER